MLLLNPMSILASSEVATVEANVAILLHAGRGLYLADGLRPTEERCCPESRSGVRQFLARRPSP